MAKFKYLQKILFFLLMGVSVCMLQACSEDDDENEGGGNHGSGSGSSSTSVGEIVPGSGKKLLSADGYKFYYFADGRIKYVVTDWDETYEFTYSPNKIICNYGDEYMEDVETMTVSYNDKGYISKMSFSEVGSDGDSSWDDTGIYDLSYDGEGHLVKAISKWTEQGVEDGESYKDTGKSTVVYTWEDGLLVKVESTATWSDGTEKEVTVFEYEAGKYKNKYKQYATFSDDYMCYLGLLGNGPDYLPVSVSYTYTENYDDEEYSNSGSRQFTYEFNEDGTLHRADDAYFTYGSIKEQGEIKKSQAKVTRAEKSRKRGVLFGLRLKHHSR